MSEVFKLLTVGAERFGQGLAVPDEVRISASDISITVAKLRSGESGKVLVDHLRGSFYGLADELSSIELPTGASVFAQNGDTLVIAIRSYKQVRLLKSEGESLSADSSNSAISVSCYKQTISGNGE